MPKFIILITEFLSRKEHSAISSKSLNLQMRQQLIRDGAVHRVHLSRKKIQEQNPRVLILIQCSPQLTLQPTFDLYLLTFLCDKSNIF